MSELLRIFKFYIVGGLNTLLSISLYSCLVLLSVNFQIALLLATLFSILFNFITYGTFVFGDAEKPKKLSFLLIYGSQYVINVWLVKFVITFGVSEIPAGISVSMATSVVTFFLFRFFVFVKSSNKN